MGSSRVHVPLTQAFPQYILLVQTEADVIEVQMELAAHVESLVSIAHEPLRSSTDLTASQNLAPMTPSAVGVLSLSRAVTRPFLME